MEKGGAEQGNVAGRRRVRLFLACGHDDWCRIRPAQIAAGIAALEPGWWIGYCPECERAERVVRAEVPPDILRDAAPEMVEVLREAVAQGEHGDGCPGAVGPCSCWMSKARVAIAKTDGRISPYLDGDGASGSLLTTTHGRPPRRVHGPCEASA
jgi:hypothetical protein